MESEKKPAAMGKTKKPAEKAVNTPTVEEDKALEKPSITDATTGRPIEVDASDEEVDKEDDGDSIPGPLEDTTNVFIKEEPIGIDDLTEEYLDSVGYTKRQDLCKQFGIACGGTKSATKIRLLEFAASKKAERENETYNNDLSTVVEEVAPVIIHDDENTNELTMSPGNDMVLPENYSKLKNDALKALCRERGLKFSGNKKVLVSRLAEFENSK